MTAPANALAGGRFIVIQRLAYDFLIVTIPSSIPFHLTIHRSSLETRICL